MGLADYITQMSMQMGGAEGVRAAEQYTLVVGLVNGMMMHAEPRHAEAYSPMRINGHAHTNGNAHMNAHAHTNGHAHMSGHK